MAALISIADLVPASLLASPSINSDGIVEWGVKNVIPILLLVIGIAIIASARKGRISDNANTITNVVLGCAVIAGAGFLYAFAGQLTTLVFGT
jgi:hypothetical protein